MTSLCHTCAVEHATDDHSVECSKMGRQGLPVGVCSKHTKTREKQLEDALRRVCQCWDEWSNDQQVIPGPWEPIDDAVIAAKELLGKPPQ